MVMKRGRVGTESELELHLEVAPSVDTTPVQFPGKEEEETAHPPLNIGEFLKKCYYCKKFISDDKEVFMYRDFCGFCSVGCRDMQMALDDKLAEKQVSSTKQNVDQQHKGTSDFKRQHLIN